MKKLIAFAVLPLIAGCLGSAPEQPVSWILDADTELSVSSVTVASPYDSVRFTVLRPDGSLAFDAYNVFAARPSVLLRVSVRTDSKSPELLVRKLALDCRKEGERNALVELELRAGAKTLARSSASLPTADGDYSKAFSAAFLQAVRKLDVNGKR